MKKFAMATVAVAALSAGVAQAYTVGTFSNGFVVPNVIHNGASDTTAVGLINQSNEARAVYWTFFDENGGALTSGCFAMKNRDYQPFIWSAESGSSMSGKRGYLVFALGETVAAPAAVPPVAFAPHKECADSAGLQTNATLVAANTSPVAGAKISGSAFQVNATNKDVAFIPVIDGPLSMVATADLTRLDPGNLTAVAGAQNVGATAAGAVAGGAAPTAPQPTFSMRYAIGTGLDTSVVVWSTADHRGTYGVDVYNDSQVRKRLNLVLKKGKMNVFDPKTLAGLPSTHTDGFIEWTPGNGGTAPRDFGDLGGTASSLTVAGGSVFTYSVINSSDLSATQTILGSHR
ncbi:hypothetical protein [Verminephrobacter aporrectodeae]|uniref:hypothetical protein n=1 Tax=Verminephrobacter aporrectodeae TaxID=1110389 RepID=UPI000496A2F5|nr:hypothetical protein [Verminephrobacter aporrectodeae]